MIRFAVLAAAYALWLSEILPGLYTYWNFLTWQEVLLSLVCTMAYPVAIKREAENVSS